LRTFQWIIRLYNAIISIQLLRPEFIGLIMLCCSRCFRFSSLALNWKCHFITRKSFCSGIDIVKGDIHHDNVTLLSEHEQEQSRVFSPIN
jgi:hypothetical protein